MTPILISIVLFVIGFPFADKASIGTPAR